MDTNSTFGKITKVYATWLFRTVALTIALMVNNMSNANKQATLQNVSAAKPVAGAFFRGLLGVITLGISELIFLWFDPITSYSTSVIVTTYAVERPDGLLAAIAKEVGVPMSKKQAPNQVRTTTSDKIGEKDSAHIHVP